jgi:cytochrome P450
MKGRALQSAKALLGDGLLTSEGTFHMRQRRMVQPAFHHERLATYAGQMVAEAQAHAAAWRDGAEIEVVSDMSALTLAIVGRTLFGSDLTGDASDVGNALGDVLEGFSQRLGPAAPALARLPLPANRRLEEAGGRLDALVQRLIVEHRAAGDNGDLLSMLIAAQEDGIGMDDRQLRDETMTLVLAGHETTAMAMSWTWWCLAREPRALSALHAELDVVLGGRPPTWDDLPALAVTRATVAEAIRLFPPAWIIGRRLLADVEVGGWTLPRGSLVLASQYAMHRDPASWPSPHAFRPKRFLRRDDATGARVFDEWAPGQPRGAWFPFGFGTRRCVGDQFAWTEATLILATLAQRWEVVPQPGVPVAPLPAVTLRPGSGIPATLRRRAR